MTLHLAKKSDFSLCKHKFMYKFNIYEVVYKSKIYGFKYIYLSIIVV